MNIRDAWGMQSSLLSAIYVEGFYGKVRDPVLCRCQCKFAESIFFLVLPTTQTLVVALDSREIRSRNSSRTHAEKFNDLIVVCVIAAHTYTTDTNRRRRRSSHTLVRGLERQWFKLITRPLEHGGNDADVTMMLPTLR